MTAPPPTKHKGVTGVLSEVMPTKDELESNEALLTELKNQNNFEPVEDTERRCVDEYEQL